MKTRLSELTMLQYIDLVCGNLSVLEGGITSRGELARIRARLMFDFSSLTSETWARSFLSERQKAERAKTEILLFKVCQNLLAAGGEEEVRDVLTKYGLNAQGMDKPSLHAELERRLKRAETESKRAARKEEEAEEKKRSEDEIRLSYDRQTASLMSYFKFHIDLSKIPASQYACLVDQANKEIKAKIEALKK